MKRPILLSVLLFVWKLIKWTLRTVLLILYVLMGGDIKELSMTPAQRQAAEQRKKKAAQEEAAKCRSYVYDDDADQRRKRRKRSNEFEESMCSSSNTSDPLHLLNHFPHNPVGPGCDGSQLFSSDPFGNNDMGTF